MQELIIEGIPTVEGTLKFIGRFSDQIPFAISKALNGTADVVRDFEVVNVWEKFKNRRDWWKPRTKFGMNITPSTKDNLVAMIYTRAPWLRLQEEGGTKTPGRYAEILVPAPDIRQSTSRLIPITLSPRKVLANMEKYHAFWIGNNIWQRTGPGKDGVRVLFFGMSSAHIPARLGFESLGIKTAKEIYDKQFGMALAFALATAKD